MEEIKRKREGLGMKKGGGVHCEDCNDYDGYPPYERATIFMIGNSDWCKP